MEDTKAWHEQDVFWETVYPILFTERRLSDASAEADKIISLLRIEPGANMLDLCCGVGRHSLELARRGFNVVGVDRTQFYLGKAAKQTEADGLNVEFVQCDMRDFCRRDAFNVVLNLYTSFGYFEDPEEDHRVVRNVYHSLKSGGLFLIETMGKEVLARIFLERNWREEDGMIILEERKLSKNWSWIDNRWMMIKGNDRTEFRVSHRLYSATELSTLLAECSFTQIDVYGSLEGSPYDHTAKRLVVVARK